MSDYRKISKAVLAVLLGLSLGACTSTDTSGTAQTAEAGVSASAGAETVTPEASASPSASASAETASSAPAATAEGEVEANGELQSAFNGLLDAVADKVYPGTAGSTLNAAYEGAEILSWYKANQDALNETDLNGWAYAYVANSDDPETVREQLSAVSSWVSTAYSADAQGTLADAGWSGDITWDEADCAAVSAALTVQTGVSAQ